MNDKFKIVAVYQYSSEAIIFKGMLESEGIEAFLQDQYTVDTDPIISNAIGGVKLAVWENDAEKAKKILSTVEEYSLDDSGEPFHCPKCNSTDIDYFTSIKSFRALISFLVSLLVVVLPFYTRYTYRCEVCHNQFNRNE